MTSFSGSDKLKREYYCNNNVYVVCVVPVLKIQEFQIYLRSIVLHHHQAGLRKSIKIPSLLDYFEKFSQNYSQIRCPSSENLSISNVSTFHRPISYTTRITMRPGRSKAFKGQSKPHCFIIRSIEFVEKMVENNKVIVGLLWSCSLPRIWVATLGMDGLVGVQTALYMVRL